MNDAVKQLELLSSLADDKYIRQLCKILIDYITEHDTDTSETNTQELGFHASQKD